MEPNELTVAKKLSDIEQRRAQLKQELESIERGLEGNFDDIKESLQQRTDPRHWIRRYPLVALGIAVGVGVVVGTSHRSGKQNTTSGTKGPSLFGELKRLMIMKGIAFAVASAEDLLADRFTPPKRRRSSQQNDEK